MEISCCFSFALVDFGLAQTYDKTSENIFEYESANSKKSSNPKVETPKHMIALAKKPKGTPKNSTTTQSSHLVLTAPKNINSIVSKNDTNSMPHTPNKEGNQG